MEFWQINIPPLSLYLQISKILEVSGNVDKASKAISSVVRELAEKEVGFFGPTLKSFISCTIAAKAQDPYVSFNCLNSKNNKGRKY